VGWRCENFEKGFSKKAVILQVSETLGRNPARGKNTLTGYEKKPLNVLKT